MDTGIITLQIAHDVIGDLNDIIYENVGDDTCLIFELETNGYDIIVNWCGLQVWSSVNDDRIYTEATDSYESLKVFLRRQLSFLQDRICKINLYSLPSP